MIIYGMFWHPPAPEENFTLPRKSLQITNVWNIKKQQSWKIVNTVKLCYNELGYNDYSVITNKNNYLVGLVIFLINFPGYNEQNPVITNKILKKEQIFYQFAYKISRIINRKSE